MSNILFMPTTPRPITSCICLGTGRVREVWSGGHSADLAPAHEGERNAQDCPDCALCNGGCEERHDRAEMHDVDGELYCEICAAALVTLSMQALGMLPRIFDTIPAPSTEAP